MSKPGRIYIAGPMTGLPEHNFPAFHAAAERLRQAGWEVVNPAENFGGQTDLPRETYLRADVALLVDCDAVAMLSGWEDSRGAKIEYLLAQELGMPVLDAENLQPLQSAPVPLVHLHRLRIRWEQSSDTPEPVLDEAKRITASDRQDDYGHPREGSLGHGRTAVHDRGQTRPTGSPSQA